MPYFPLNLFNALSRPIGMAPPCGSLCNTELLSPCPFVGTDAMPRKRPPDGPQNFKYVAWGDVAKALKLD
jgi:hypothetical protein